MKWFAAVFALLATFATAAYAKTPEDVLGRPVPLGQGRPALVFHTNRDNQQALHDEAFPFTYSVREAMPIVVVHVDLSDVPGLFMGAAKDQIKKAERESLAEMRRIFRAHGQEPPPQLADSLYMVADPDGKPERALGLEKHFKTPFAEAIGSDGQPLARGPFPQAAGQLAKALKSHAPKLTASR